MPSSAMMNGPGGVISPGNPCARPQYGRLKLVPSASFGERALPSRLGPPAKAPVRLSLISSD
jgi:hypothetical protein